MLKNQNIICISSIDWDFAWQGHQEIMATFAKNGNRVLFIENTGVRAPGIRDFSRIKIRIKNWLKGIKGIRKETENLYVYSPLVLPFPYSHMARWINRQMILPLLDKWMKVMDFGDPIIWTFLPTGIALDIIENLPKKVVVYYCIADFESLVKNRKKLKNSEKKIIEKSDVVFAQGREIKKHCEEYGKNNISIFPFGVNLDRFTNYKSLQQKPEDIAHIKGHIVGYIGGIHKHVDFELIRFLAENNPRWNFIFIGPLQKDILSFKDLKNIIFLDMKQHRDLAHYIENFDVCIIPYLLNEYTRTVYPTKLNEYNIMGKPVVSTMLPEIVYFNERHGDIVYIAKNKEEFKNLIQKAAKEDKGSLRNRRIEVAKGNSWNARIEKMEELIIKAIDKKKKDSEVKWKENLLLFYRQARRRTFRVIATLLIFYLLLFKTPFVWLLAEPLKIEDRPEHVDTIVVFGGGVGETGSPGKSTIERARYAVELYKKGYADKIIFSSGYTYKYNDAKNMRLFALSMNVRDKNIILEQRANSAYENVLFSKEILDKFEWESILVVSSPYNMRRVELVFKKHGSDIKVIHTPVRGSEFYERMDGITLAQLRAIAHEYLGIVYYFFKGYI
ncbi:ElyC/SanA/YdcF family protein [Candidatus Omnitrophota bacterium]